MTRRKSQHTAALAPGPSMADIFKAKLGWKPSTEPFHTSANRQCGSCRDILPGNEFDLPVTPGRPGLNVCRECST